MSDIEQEMEAATLSDAEMEEASDDEEYETENEEEGEENEGEGEEGEEEEEEQTGPAKVYLPGQKLEDGEELVCEESAYHMFHQASTTAPCLSFDIIPDGLGNDRTMFPHTAYLVAGTQGPHSFTNRLLVMKMSNMQKTKPPESSDSEDSDDEETELKPDLDCAVVHHQGSVNRVRMTVMGDRPVAASWAETGKVHIWDLTRPLQAVNDSASMANYVKNKESPSPLFTFKGHSTEGFAVDWSPTEKGILATGDCKKNIHVWKPLESGQWAVDQRPLLGHTASVEDLQWSPNEPSVLASCSVDKSVRVWDTRANPSKANMLTAANAHESDVNVIHWNRREPFIISGGDDGKILVWDLRQFQSGKPVAVFKHHTAPITSVEWHPSDSTVFASAGADDQIAQWDLAVEKDEEAAQTASEDLEKLPPQLLFIHQGQKEIKELHWHPQIPGLLISTALSGFHLFKTISV